MYQEFFGFNSRPFPTHGAPSPFIPTPATDEVLPALERCVRQGRGIAILTAPTGTGKTAVAHELRRRIAEELHVVYLSSSNYQSGRGLLQSVLFELGVDYTGISEEEARLQIIEFAKRLSPETEGLVLIVDEAHQLGERLLEELRTLAGYTHEGRSLLRLVLSGQLELDERLAAPELAAFNQRVGCQVVLEPLDRMQSAAYVRDTLSACGADPAEVLSKEALDLICAASDGNVRCLHHLCDHALLLAFVAEEKPVSEATVRAALDDLQELPLNWTVPAAPADAIPGRDHEEYDPVSSEKAIVDIEEHDGDDSLDDFESGSAEREPVTQTEPDVVDAKTTVIEFGSDEQQEISVSAPLPAGEEPTAREFRLEDRYADLDRIAELAHQAGSTLSSIDSATIDAGEHCSTELSAPHSDARQTSEGKLLAAINEMRAELRNASADDSAEQELPDSSRQQESQPGVTDDENDWDVILPEPEAEVVSTDSEVPRSQERGAMEQAANDVDEGQPTEQSKDRGDAANRPTSCEQRIDPADASRRYAFLFTRLRNRRRELAARADQ